MKLYRNGTSSYMGGVGDHERAPRGDIVGWSAAAARRQTQWLWTVDADQLTGSGHAITLTMRDCPPSSMVFVRARDLWTLRVLRMGATRVHWVVEWQRRGVPHIHAAVYFDRPFDAADSMRMLLAWVEIAAAYSPSLYAQYYDEISGPLGWLKYLAKHASRGAAHYQRQGHPEAWKKTGRLWGYRGAWPTITPIELTGLNNREFWRVRRLMRHWSVAEAKRVGDFKRATYLQRRAARPDRKQSSYQGVAEWIPESVSLRLVAFLETEAG